MEEDASGKKHRNIILRTNKYQEKIILLTFLPSAVMFLFFICIVFVANPDISYALIHTSFIEMEKLIYRFPWLIIAVMFVIFLFSMLGAYLVSYKMVGASGRINRELDEIIAGHSQKTIKSRPDEEMTKELIKRINVLVKHYVATKDKK